MMAEEAGDGRLKVTERRRDGGDERRRGEVRRSSGG